MTTALVSNAKSIQKLIFDNESKLAALLPSGLDPKRMLQIAWMLVRQNPKLLECTPESVVSGIGQGFSLGLSFDPVLGHAFLVPYWNKKQRILQAQFQAGYRGLANLAYRSEKIVKIYSEVVHAEDTFEVFDGTEQRIIHKKNLEANREEEKDWIGAYAVAETKDGVTFSKYMTRAEILKRKMCSQSAESDYSPWTTSAKDMWLKTPIRALAKLLPMSPDTEMAIRAAIEDEYRDAGIETPELPSPGEIEVSPEAVPELPTRKVMRLDWQDADVAHIPFMPKPIEEQAKCKDYATFLREKKVWIIGATDVQAFTELANGCGYDVIETPAPTREPGQEV